MAYDLKSVTMPRLAGRSLSLVAALLENGLTGRLLGGRLAADTGIGVLRAFPVDEDPTFVPRLPFGGPAATPADRPDLAALLERTAGWTRPAGSPHATIAEYHAAYRAGTTDPLAVAERALEAIAASDRGAIPLRAFLSVNRDDVHAQARASAARWAAGTPLGPLDGVPMCVKDEMDQAGHPTTLGTPALARGPAPDDAGGVTGLRRAGALLLGKTNMQEIGMGVYGTNAHYGHARNPINPAYHTGGSSSGTAAAVQAGIVPVGVGADGGGSIRIPAAFCGTVGLKPTFGRVSEFAAATLCWSVGYAGPIATTARDALLAFAAMAGPDPRDPGSLLQPPLRFDALDRDDLGDLTLGICRPWFAHASREIVEACDAQVAAFRRRGAKVRDVEIPDLDAARVAHVVTITGEALSSMRRRMGDHRAVFGPETRIVLAIASQFSAADYVAAQRVRTRCMAHMARALDGVDAIVTPATGVTAPLIAAGTESGVSDVTVATEIMRFAFLTNLTGHPSISFPVGHAANGMPIGLQATAHAWREDTCLRLAAAAERDVPRRAGALRFPSYADA
ncbi:MAG: amidase [Gemmatimonadetes bacterium]|nr:amidase [Gemmatimonadota bacterium]